MEPIAVATTTDEIHPDQVMSHQPGSSPGAEQARLYASLAVLLDYPHGDLNSSLATCRALAATMAPEASDDLGAFDTFVRASTPGQLEEAYTAFFDLNPVCSPYVGHLLFGESYKRSAFLVELNEHYRSHRFEIDGAEIADRLSVMLAFMAACDDDEERRSMTVEAVLPALDRLTGVVDDRVGPPSGEDTSPQLEGHSEGEVLAPGFLLGLTEGPGASDPDEHPYRRLLRGSRLLLEAAWPRGDDHVQSEGAPG